MRLSNGFEIPQIGVGTWTLRGEIVRQNVRLAVRQGKVRSIGVSNFNRHHLDDMQAISALNQNLRSNALNDPETFPW